MSFKETARASVKVAIAGVFAFGLLASPATAGVITIGTTGATVTCSVAC